jgi:predicted phosphodiesterase
MVAKKVCRSCKLSKEFVCFGKRPDSIDGYRSQCNLCRLFRKKTKRAAERIASDHDVLKPKDFDVSIGNDGRKDAKATQEKRQEFSRSMGEFARHLVEDELTEKDGAYIGALAEQERRFQNRRIARSVSITAANEALHLRLFKSAAKEYLNGRITPTGYATKKHTKDIKRAVCLLLSDLHIGSDLSGVDNPVEYIALQEARRLEYIVRQTIDFKPQYRGNSELLLFLGGDIIDGMLLHDQREGAPLTEQMIAFWKYFSAIIGLFAQTFPKVKVICQPGNHGRNKLRHPGRATSSKWDGIEFQLYYGLSMMASNLPNVEFDIGFRALSIVDIFGSKVALTHGDTEVKLGHPDRKAEKNMIEVIKLNASNLYDTEFDAVLAGHWHTPRFQPGHPSLLFNGMLCPPNGYARTAGYIMEQCGQWLWEAVEGFPIGDLRYVSVGAAQDEDESLGKLIVPWRIDDE